MKAVARSPRHVLPYYICSAEKDRSTLCVPLMCMRRDEGKFDVRCQGTLQITSLSM
jgi:hypothetical protein